MIAGTAFARSASGITTRAFFAPPRACSGIIAGKLKGVIAATTPIGWRTISTTHLPLVMPLRGGSTPRSPSTGSAARQSASASSPKRTPSSPIDVPPRLRQP